MPLDGRSPRTVLIAGAGDVGMRLADRLLSAGRQVIAVRRDASSIAPRSGLVTVSADLADVEPTALPPADAAVICVAGGRRDPAGYERTYVGTTRTILSWAADAPTPRPIVFTSSTSVFGGGAEGEVVEVDDDTPASPDSPTAEVLVEAERLVLDAGGRVVRVSGIFGPGRLRLVQRVADGEPPDDLGRMTNRIHADDVAAALEVALLDADLPATVVASDGASVPLYDVVTHLAGLLGRPGPSGPLPAAHGKRVTPRALSAAGLVLEHPDWRVAYERLVTDAGLAVPQQTSDETTTA